MFSYYNLSYEDSSASSCTLPTVTTPSNHSPALAVIPVAIPTSPLQATEFFSSPSNVTPSEHHKAEHFTEHDGDEDFFLKPEDLDDPATSTKSSKKRKMEERRSSPPILLFNLL